MIPMDVMTTVKKQYTECVILHTALYMIQIMDEIPLLEGHLICVALDHQPTSPLVDHYDLPISGRGPVQVPELHLLSQILLVLVQKSTAEMVYKTTENNVIQEISQTEMDVAQPVKQNISLVAMDHLVTMTLLVQQQPMNVTLLQTLTETLSQMLVTTVLITQIQIKLMMMRMISEMCVMHGVQQETL